MNTKLKLIKGQRVRLVGSIWVDLQGTEGTIVQTGYLDGRGGDEPTARVVVDKDGSQNCWYLWDAWQCEVIGFGTCIRCHHQITDEVHYLCPDCRL